MKSNESRGEMDLNLIELDQEKYNMIPHNWGMGAIKFYSITFDGWDGFHFDVADSTLLIILDLSRRTLNNFTEIYKETHAFTHPELIFRPDLKKYTLKIGIMDIELYNELKEKNE
jgi:hypothetical protein